MRFCITAVLCLFFGKTAGLSADEVQPKILASYVAVAYSRPLGEAVGLVRAITPLAQQAAPAILLDGEPVSPVARKNPDPAAFPVNVWEAVIPLGARVSVAGQPLPTIVRNPAKVVVFGDSGCKSDQGCDDPANWPFGLLTAHAATLKPDLVIHAGDYNYRGTPSHSPPGNEAWVYDGCGGAYVTQQTQDMPYGDNWHSWFADFFTPAAPLLKAAPWVFTRGNHELCARAGTGFFYLVSPHSPLLGKGQPVNPCEGRQTFTADPYHLDLGTVNLLVADTANFCGESLVQEQVPGYTKVYETLMAMTVPRRRANWLLGHRPLFCAGEPLDTQGMPGMTKVAGAASQTMTAVLEQPPLTGWNEKVWLMISGHVHKFEFFSPVSEDWPMTMIVGNSGVRLDNPPLDGLTFAQWEQFGDKISALGYASTKFGYAWLEADGEIWRGRLFGADGGSITTFAVSLKPVFPKR